MEGDRAGGTGGALGGAYIKVNRQSATVRPLRFASATAGAYGARSSQLVRSAERATKHTVWIRFSCQGCAYPSLEAKDVKISPTASQRHHVAIMRSLPPGATSALIAVTRASDGFGSTKSFDLIRRPYSKDRATINNHLKCREWMISGRFCDALNQCITYFVMPTPRLASDRYLAYARSTCLSWLVHGCWPCATA